MHPANVPGILLRWNDGCHLLCNVKLLLARRCEATTTTISATQGANTAEASRPLMLGFEESVGGTVTRWLGQEEVSVSLVLLGGADRAVRATLRIIYLRLDGGCVQAIFASLEPLKAAILAANPSAEEPSGHLPLCLSLGKLRGLPLMPSLHGWLLGYPVIYIVRSMDEAQRAARCLSADDITVFRASVSASPQAAGMQLREGGGKEVASSNGCMEACILSAFSVPTRLCLPHGCSETPLVLGGVVEAWAGRMGAVLLSEIGEVVVKVELLREDRGLQSVSL